MVATARDLRFKTSDLLSAVSRGEDVVITFRGKPTARLSPFRLPQKSASKSNLSGIFGLWKDHKDIEDVASHVRSLRKSRFE